MYVHVVRGEVIPDGETMPPGDAARSMAPREMTAVGVMDAELLMWGMGTA